MGDIGDWFRGIPQMTRYWFGGTVGISLLGRFGLLPFRLLVLNYYEFFYGFKFWLPVTALFFYPINPSTGFHFLMNLYFLYSYSMRLETGVFSGKPADYLFCLLFMWLCCVTAALLGGFITLMDSMVIAVLYVWCQLNKDTIVTFWFGTQFKAMYMPWVLLGFNLILGRSDMVMMEVVGIVVGHLYFFLTFKYPQDFGGRAFLQTPDILLKYFPNQRGFVSGFGQAPQYRPTSSNAQSGGEGSGGGGGGGGHNIWGGSGNRLGD